MTGKIKVCHLISADLWAGAETQAFNLIKGLNAIDALDLRVITFNRGLLASKIKDLGIQIDIIDEKETGILKSILVIRKILREKGTEILHTHGFKETFLGGIASRMKGIRAIIRTHHGKGVVSGSIHHRFIEKLNSFFFETQAIIVSDELKKYLLSRKFSQNMVVIHNGINKDDITPTLSGSIMREQLNIGSDRIIIGSIGRLVDVKGHTHFLQGALKVISKYSRAFFVIAGEGPLMEKIKAEIRQLGIEEHVRLTGFRSDPFNIINMLDIFALTSLHEGIPMVLLEAMCLAKPVIATEVGGIPEVIRHRENGLLIPAADPQAFTQACFDLIGNKTLRESLAENARNDVIENFGIQHAVEKTVTLYRSHLK